MVQHRRGPWSQQEDAALLQLVQVHGPHNWVRISQLVGSRSPKQCRERFHQNLKPTLNHEPITPEEGVIIEKLVGEMGKRWAEIARRLHGRSDNAVKNWWNGGMNRRRRLCLRNRSDSRDDAVDDYGDYDDGQTSYDPQTPYDHQTPYDAPTPRDPQTPYEPPTPYEPHTPYDMSVPSSPHGFAKGLPSLNSTLVRRESVDNFAQPMHIDYQPSNRVRTPSLMSESISQLSLNSPSIPPTPSNGSAITLPPLVNHADSRRQSVSMSVRSHESIPEYGVPSLTSSSSSFTSSFSSQRFSTDNRSSFSMSSLSSSSSSKSSDSKSSTNSSPYSFMRTKKVTPMPTLFDAKTVRSESRRKDSRMNLANICS